MIHELDDLTMHGFSSKTTVPPRGSAGPPVWNALFGIVRPDVTLIVMRMSDGREVSLRPVAAAGKRLVGLVLRAGRAWSRPSFTRAGPSWGTRSRSTAGNCGRGPIFVTWLRAFQPGPARADRFIATGGSGGNGWDALVLADPRGYCASLNTPVARGSRQDCWSPAALRRGVGVIMRTGSPAAIPRWIIGTISPPVTYLRLTLAGHAT